MTVLLLILAALFTWILYTFLSWESRDFEHVAIVDYDRFAVPVIPFALQDQAAFQSLPGFRENAPSRFNLDQERFRSFCNSLAQRSGSTLILHISAQGLTDGNAAYLACTDFSVDGSSGRMPLKDLLQALQQCKTRFKLLILDANRLPADPRLGMLINEFARLVIKEVEKLPDSSENLWVLLPSKPFQTTQDAYGYRRSMFGLAVEEALSGKANLRSRDNLGSDGNSDRFITLYELYYYVLTRCGNWYERGQTEVAQVPILLRGKQGFIRIDQAKTFGDKNGKYKTYRLKTVAKASPPEDTPPTDKKADADAKGAKEKLPQSAGNSLGRSANFATWSALGPLAMAESGPGSAAERPSPPQPPPQGVKREGEQPKQDAKAPTASKPPQLPEQPGASPVKTAPAVPALAGPEKDLVEKPLASEPSPKPKAGPGEQFLTLLARAWQLRDELQDPSQRQKRATQLCPVDFAPHLWREVEMNLLDYEQRCLGGYLETPPPTEDGEGKTNSDGSPSRWRSNDPERLQQLVDVLEQLKTSLESGKPLEGVSHTPESIEDRLLEAWSNRLEKWTSQEQQFEREESDFVVRFRDQLRQFHSLAYSAPYYVRWHARASRCAASELGIRESILAYLSSLQKVQESIYRLESGSDVDISTVAEPLDLVQLLDLGSARKIKSELDTQLADLASTNLGNLADPLSHVNLALLVSTPLLTAGERFAVLRGLRSVPAAILGPQLSTPPRVESLSVQLPQWDRVSAHVQLEQRLLQLASAKQRVTLKDVPRPLPEYTPEKHEEGLWDEYRLLGDELRTGYVALVSSLDEPRTSRPFSDLTLHLVDPRDRVRRLLFPDFDFSKFKRKPMILATLAGGPQTIRVAADREAKVAFEVRATSLELSAIPLVLDYDSAVLQLKRIESSTPRKDAGVFRKTVTCYLVAQQFQAPDRRAVLLRLAPTVPDVPFQSAQVECLLPNPDRVELLATRDGLSRPEPEEGDTLQLELFPGHTTRYLFELRNQSDAVKNVSVALYAIPEFSGFMRSPGRIPPGLKDQIVSRSGLLHERVEGNLLGRIEKLALEPRGEKKLPLVFPAPRASQPAAGSEKPAAKGNAKEPPPDFQPRDMTHGLVCLISDLDSTEKKTWVKWIELEPRYPRQYLTAEVRYETKPGSERLVAHLKPSPGEDLPRDAPVQVAWDQRELLREGIPPTGRLDGQIRNPDDSLELYASLAPDGRERFIRLTVDSCPRAFIFRVTCKPSAAGVESLRGISYREDANDLNITRIAAPGQSKVYHFPPFLDWPDEKPAPKQPGDEILDVQLPDGQPAVFRETSRLRVSLRSDANDDFGGEQDAIVVYVRGDEKERLYSDRQIATRLLRFGDRGSLDLRMDVSDHVIDVDPQETNTETTIHAAIILNGQTRGKSDPIRVILDSLPPTIGPLRIEPRIAKGSSLTALIPVEDISPIVEVRYAFLEQAPRELDATNSTGVTPGESGRGLVSARVNAGELDVGRHTLWLQVWDQAGWKSPLASGQIEIVVPTKPARKGTVRGQIKLVSGRNVNGLLFQSPGDVTLWQGDKLADRVPEVRGDGSFFIHDLPAGSYSIKAKGSDSGRSVSGESTKEFAFDNPAQTESWDVFVK